MGQGTAPHERTACAAAGRGRPAASGCSSPSISRWPWGTTPRLLHPKLSRSASRLAARRDRPAGGATVVAAIVGMVLRAELGPHRRTARARRRRGLPGGRGLGGDRPGAVRSRRSPGPGGGLRGHEIHVADVLDIAHLILTGAAAAGGIALINSVANLGGLLGPTVMGQFQARTGSFAGGTLVMAAALGTGRGPGLFCPASFRRDGSP